jgi:hypothetical protein
MKFGKFSVLAGAVLAVMLAVSPSRAAEMPSEEERDILIISTLLRLNDANISGNYSVLRDLATREFREKNSTDAIAQAFKEFRSRAIRMEELAVREIHPDEEGEMTHDGIVRLSGYIDLSRFRMKYVLRFVMESGIWRMQSIQVDLDQ